MKYTTMLFDLDGTLTNPGLGITNSVAYALKKYGIDVKDRTELYKFIGPPLLNSFQDYYGFSEEQAVQAVEYYREYYQKTGIYENYVYEGIPELLKELTAEGITLLVATSKPEPFARLIMEHYHLAEYFTYIAGATMDNKTRVKKADVIRYAMQNCEAEDKEKLVMVGDRKHDILGTKEVGIDSIGVLFGYGDREELEQAGATYIAETVEAIRTCIE